MAFGIPLDKPGYAGSIANDKGIGFLENAVKRAFERLHVTELVAGFV